MTKDLLMTRNLPKWPQMKVSGVPVSKEQAMEIIRRTDSFFWDGGGNNHEFNRQVKKALQIPVNTQWDAYPGCKIYDDWDSYWQDWESWIETWGFIPTNYVCNDWISCSFILGPHGWMHPNGTIGFIDNIGKWPEISDVYDDWVKLAAEFPFLDIGVTLMNGEECEDGIEPVVSFIVKNGTVEVVDPKEINVHEEHEEMVRGNREGLIISYINNPSSENAIPMEEILEWRKYLNK